MSSSQLRARLHQRTKSAAAARAHDSSGSPAQAQKSSREAEVEAEADKTDKTDKATALLIRRVLGGPGAAELPALTSSNAVDVELYGLVAAGLREYVIRWYGRLSNDHELARRVVEVVAHCTLAVEGRLRGVDVRRLLLDEVPAVVERHVFAFRTARAQAAPNSDPFRAVYHTLNPHGALARSDAADEYVYRQLLAQGALAVLLPTEELENDGLRTLVADLVADRLLGGVVGGLLSDSGFVWESIAAAAEAVERRWLADEARPRRERPRPDDHNDSDNDSSQSTLVVVLWGVVQGCFWLAVVTRHVAAGLYAAATAATATAGQQRLSARPSARPEPVRAAVPVLEWRIVPMIGRLFELQRRMPWLDGGIALGRHLLVHGPGGLAAAGGILDRFLRNTIDDVVLPPSLVPAALWLLRMSLFPPPGSAASGVGAINSGNPKSSLATTPITLQRPANKSTALAAVPHAKPTIPLSPGQLTAAFPPSGSPVDATGPGRGHGQDRERNQDPAALAARKKCASRLLRLIPVSIALALFVGRIGDDEKEGEEDDANGDGDEKAPAGGTNAPATLESALPSASSVSDTASYTRRAERALEHDVLDLAADAWCNRHVAYALTDLVVVRLLPELTARGVSELMAERGVG